MSRHDRARRGEPGGVHRTVRRRATVGITGGAGVALRGRVVIHISGASVLLVCIAALAMYDTEQGHPDALITTFWDALWWAVVSITTAGYGDLCSVTAAGRVIASALMIYGIALLGVVTGALAS